MRTFVLNLGNSTLFGGMFIGSRRVTSFRVPKATIGRGVGLAAVLAKRVRGPVNRVALCSVVPALTQPVMKQLRQYFGVKPRLLSAAAAHGLKIGYRQPGELGADRLAAVIGARALFPGRHVIIIDCGTATTVTALSKQGVLLGGAILPGVGLWSAILQARTAQLPHVPLRRPRVALGRSTTAGLQSGIFYGHVGAVRELVRKIHHEAFGRAPALVIGTGGHAESLTKENLFTVHEPGLILSGLHHFAALPAHHA